MQFGTAIASGWVKGKYPNKTHDNHGGLFGEYIKDPAGKRIGFTMFDQWNNKAGGAAWRSVYPKEGLSDPSNNANCFNVIKGAK